MDGRSGVLMLFLFMPNTLAIAYADNANAYAQTAVFYATTYMRPFEAPSIR